MGGMPNRARAAQGVEDRDGEGGRWCFAPWPLLPTLRGRRVGSIKRRFVYKHLRPLTAPADGATSFSSSLRPL